MRRHIQPLESRRLLASVMTMYTYAGDMNFDGVVSGDDYGVIDNTIQLQGGGWYQGDFNYDGVIDANDYAIIDNNLGGSGGGTLIGPPSITGLGPSDFFGTARRDVITVTTGANGGISVSVNGNATNTNAGKLTIFAGNGNDKVHIDLPESYAAVSLITIHGGGGDDAIVGGIAAERVIAGDGNDFVLSSGGRDTVYGEAGDDSLRGGGSSDLLDGGAGNDTLRGDTGNDNLSGGDGSDRIRGNLGNDVLDGGASRDFIGGEVGNDRVFGGGGADAIHGGEDDDTLDGGAGDDHCAGDAGHDNLAGGSGVDQLFGGEGTDHCATADDERERADTDLADLAPPGGKFDLNNNQLVTNTPAGSASGGIYTGIQGTVQNAYNSGQWSQPGLTTSMPDTITGLTTIGVATGEQISGLGPTDTAIFGGHTITGTSTIAMYTYAGDANLDGMVDAADYEIIDAFAQIPGASGYANGDFNYDGVINGADYAIIDFSAAIQGAVQPAPSPPA